jgi:Outer membrane protein beta-barrel domain
MTSTPFAATRTALVAISITLIPVLTGAAVAQDRPSPTLDLSAGWVGFADDGIVNEAMVGGAGRLYLSPRIALGPELLYIDGTNHSHLVLTGNLTVDLIAPTRGRAPIVTPFLVVGGGMFQTRESFFGEDYTHTEGAFTAGGGVRAAAGDRVTVGVDARIGWEAHLRVNGVVGIRLGR